MSRHHRTYSRRARLLKQAMALLFAPKVSDWEVLTARNARPLSSAITLNTSRASTAATGSPLTQRSYDLR